MSGTRVDDESNAIKISLNNFTKFSAAQHF